MKSKLTKATKTKSNKQLVSMRLDEQLVKKLKMQAKLKSKTFTGHVEGILKTYANIR